MASTRSSWDLWRLIVAAAILVALVGAVAAVATRTPAPPPASASPGTSAPASNAATPSSPAVSASTAPEPSSSGLAGAGGGGGADGGGGGGSGGAGSAGGAGATPAPTPPPTPASPTPGSGPAGPYAVKQIESLGGEAISGFVCSPSRPFSVGARTSRVAWTFRFVPRSGTAGSVSYAYSIPSAGETHSATGTYTISRPDSDGTLHLSMAVSDHVVFKGFDGKIPVQYKFDLVPSANTSCP